MKNYYVKNQCATLASDTVHRLLGSSGLRILRLYSLILLSELPGADAQLTGGG